MDSRIANAKIMAVDIETYDPGISKDMGPGVYRGDGYILDIAIATDTGFRKAYNIGHYDVTPEMRKRNVAEVREILMLDITKIGANIQYDVDWIENWKESKIANLPAFFQEGLQIPVGGKLYDVQVAEPLIDETQMHNNLDFLAKKYLGYGKVAGKPQKFCEENNLRGDFRQWLYKMPFYMVEEYVLGDVDEPILIFEKQEAIMHEEETFDLFEMECHLLRVLIHMRKQGVRIDTKVRDRNALELQSKKEKAEYTLFDRFGEFNINSTHQIAPIFDSLGIEYPLTDKGNASIDQVWLKRLAAKDMEVPTLILEARKAGTVINNFLLGSYTNFLTEGDLIHCSYYNTRIEQTGGMNGTRSGRLSTAKPNLQQIPAPGVDTYLGTMARTPFVPTLGKAWGKIDYSQIEYRFLAHFAVGEGSDLVRSKYNDDPHQDYHQHIIDLTKLKRRFAKNLNFGVAYGMGAKHMAEYFQWELEYAYDILKIYHKAAPYVKATSKKIQQVAERRGYIKTFLNRRSHLKDKKKSYTMFCRLLQGSAADLMKLSMVESYDKGLYDILDLHITVHDELDVSIPPTLEGAEAYIELKQTMEDCIQLKVPVKAEMEVGDSWGTIQEVENQELSKHELLEIVKRSVNNG